MKFTLALISAAHATFMTGPSSYVDWYTDEMSLAQTFTEQSRLRHTCSTAMDRNKETVDDFLTINEGSKKYVDKNFPVKDALYWRDAGENHKAFDKKRLHKKVKWSRAGEWGGKYALFGENGPEGISPRDSK